MHFSAEMPIDIRKTLWGSTPVSYLELKYDLDDNDGIDFILKDQAINFGNRPTGAKLRKLVMNILQVNNGKYIIINMKDIAIIASSFADEFIGKLVVEFGFIDFSSYIRFSNVNSLCRDIINLAVIQRIAQNYGMNNITFVDDNRES